MQRITGLLLLFLLTLGEISAQTGPVLVPLKKVSGSFPFRPTFYPVTPSHYPVKKDFPGIPQGLDQYQVYEFDFNPGQRLYEKSRQGGQLSRKNAEALARIDPAALTDLPHNHSVHLLVGIRRTTNSKIVVVDEDNDGSFANDRVFAYDLAGRYHLSEVETTLINYEIFDGKKIRSKALLFKVDPVVNRSNPFAEGQISANDLTVSIMVNEHQTGSLALNGSKYYFAIQTDFSESTGNFQLYLSAPDTWFQTPPNLEETQRMKDTIYLGSSAFRVDGLLAGESGYNLKLMPVGNMPARRVGRLEGRHAFSFDVLSLNDSSRVSSSALQGKYTLLDFWGPWCQPCIQQFPRMKELYDRYSGQGRFQLIGVAFPLNGMSLTELKQFVGRHELPWRQLVDDGYHREGAIQRLLISAYPTLILLDPEGKIVYRGDTLEKAEAILAERLNGK